MNVNRYLFQSPSASQVQVGKLDPSSKSEDTSAKSSQANNTQVSQKEQPVAKEVQVESNVVEQIEPTISTQQIDIYV